MITHLHLGPRLRMSGVVPPVPKDSVMAWIDTTLLSFSSSSEEFHCRQDNLRSPQIVGTLTNNNNKSLCTETHG